MARRINTENVAPYAWQDVCRAWPLVDGTELSLKQEHMPPGSGEVPHRHRKARQVFFVLDGHLTLDVEGETHVLAQRDAVEIAPTEVHQARNDHQEDVTFLVISSPSTALDRETVAVDG